MIDIVGCKLNLLLAADSLKSPNGTELREVATVGSSELISDTKLYNHLDALVEYGFLEKQSTESRSNVYQITESGKRFISDYTQWIGNTSPTAKSTAHDYMLDSE